MFPTNAAVEADFNRRQWKWKKESEFRLENLEVVEECQVRGVTDRANPSVVSRYATALQAGQQLPAGIVADVRVGDRTVTTPVDIHHREAACKKIGRTTYPVYHLFDVSPIQLKMLALRMNRHHGYILSDNEALVAVGELIEAGMSIDAIVRETGLARSKVDRAVHNHKFLARVESLTEEFDDDERRRLSQLGSTARSEMSRRIQHEPVFEEAVRLTVDAGLTGTEAQALTKQVATAKSDEEALSILTAERELYAERIQAITDGMDVQKQSPLRTFIMHSKSLLHVEPHLAVDANPVTHDESHRLARELFVFARTVLQGYGEDGCETITANGHQTANGSNGHEAMGLEGAA
jgi:ParB-like chromosome segregation protein Spo0J